MQGYGTTATLSVLTGKPEDKDVKPQQYTITANSQFSYDMPAYSLSVIRIPANTKKK